MAKLTWSNTAQQKYESGVDRGVFYPLDGPGVVWNGLVSVDESSDGGEISSYYFDGIKYLDIVSSKTFQATLNSFATPKGFSSVIGEKPIAPGFILTRQTKARFNFAYRSNVGSGNYKLHLVYNALARPDKRGYSSMSDKPAAEVMSWQINTIPPTSPTSRQSTAHIVVDSSKTSPGALASLETLLYGDDSRDPRMPSLSELVDLLAYWDPVVIIPNDISGLSALSDSENGDLTKTGTPGLNRATATTRLSPVKTRVEPEAVLETAFNFCVDPSAANVACWVPYGMTIAQTNLALNGELQSIRATVSQAGVPPYLLGGGQPYYYTVMALTQGKTNYSGVTVVSETRDAVVYACASFYDSNLSNIGPAFSPVGYSALKDVPVETSMSFVTPSNATFVVIGFYVASTMSVGDTFRYSRAWMSDVNEYFRGSFVDDIDSDYRWAGASGASESYKDTLLTDYLGFSQLKEA